MKIKYCECGGTNPNCSFCYGRGVDPDSWDRLVALGEPRSDSMGPALRRYGSAHGRPGNGTWPGRHLTRQGLDTFAAREHLHAIRMEYAKLAQLYQDELSVPMEVARRIDLLGRLAWIQEIKLRDPTAAMHTYLELASIEPLNAVARDGLERVGPTIGDWRTVDPVLVSRSSIAVSPADRARHLTERAVNALQYRQSPYALSYATTLLAEASRLIGPGPGPDFLVSGLEALLPHPSVEDAAAHLLRARYEARSALSAQLDSAGSDSLHSPARTPPNVPTFTAATTTIRHVTSDEPLPHIEPDRPSLLDSAFAVMVIVGVAIWLFQNC